MTSLPYGTWPSPLAPSDLAAAVIGLDRAVVDQDRTYWSESRPDQGGRTSLWCLPEGAQRPVELTTERSVGNSINGYGGGAWAVASGIVVHSDAGTGELFVIEHGRSRQFAPGGGLGYGCLQVVPTRRMVLAVREDHRKPGPCSQAVVALDLDSANPDGGRVLVSGADFYSGPVLSASGALAWVQWSLPDMPWDASLLLVSSLTDPANATLVAGGPEVSVMHPMWAPDGSLVFLSDESGFWNFHRWDHATAKPLHRHPFDFAAPAWTADPPGFSLFEDGRIGCSWYANGVARLGILHPGAPDEAMLQQLDLPAVTFRLAGRGAEVAARLGYPDRPAEVVRLNLESGHTKVLRRCGEAPLDADQVSLGRQVTWDSPDGPVYAWYYPPTNPDYTGDDQELPPVQVWCHGGPTDLATPEFRLNTQFWTSRGFGILEVNYSGSAGYGRAYRTRLDRAWGVADVRDCIAGAQALVAAGLADPDRLSIRGGSAGGLTALTALAHSPIFAAGILLYPVADLEALTQDTHKFEAGYFERLIGPYPKDRQTYLDRSPVNFAKGVTAPLLLFQGRADQVVPPAQAKALASAVHSAGGNIELVWFDDERHGFRKAESIITTAETTLAFLGRVHGFA